MSSSSTQTPGPTAKRRRVDTANATLRKPFRSPMIRRPSASTPGQETSTTPGPGATPGPGPTPARPTSSAVFTTPTPATPTPFTTKGPLTRRPLPTLTRPSRPGPGAETSPTKTTTTPAEQQEEDPAVQEQALKIIRQTRPGQPVDAELKAATEKWRVAGRAAAEDLFELVKGRGFTMLAMLRSLNIEPELLGYDAKEGKWKD